MRQRAAALSVCALLVAASASAAELLVSDRATSRILAFDAASGALTRVVSDSPLLSEPTGLALGPGGFLYVANLQSDVVKVDPATGAASVFAAGTAGAGGIAYEPLSSTLFVSEFGQFDGDEVFQFDAAGGLLRTVTTTPPMPTGRTGMTFDGAGNLYVGSFANDQTFSGSVLKFDAAANYSPAGTFAAGSGLAGANGMAFDAAGDLYVTGLLGQQVVKYDVEQGAVVGGAAVGGPIAYPSGVLVLDGGDLLVTSLGNNNPQDPIYGSFLFPGGVFRYRANGSRVGLLRSDFNGDQAVNGADLAAWASAFGAAAQADVEGDGDSDGADFLVWQQSFGNQSALGSFQPTGVVLYAPAPAAVAVPEPTAAAALAAILLLLPRRRL